MKLKRIIALSLSAAGLALALTACGSSSSASDDAAQASGSSDAQTTVKLGVVGAIYEDIWAPAKEKLADEGIDLEFVQFSDYVTPNNALANGEIDLNAFQHRIYLQSEIDSYGYEINKTVRELSGGRYELKEATLYTAFKRLEETGQIMSYWGSEATGARRRYYRITPAGRMAYQEQVGVWEATKEIIDRLIAMEEES